MSRDYKIGWVLFLEMLCFCLFSLFLFFRKSSLPSLRSSFSSFSSSSLAIQSPGHTVHTHTHTRTRTNHIPPTELIAITSLAVPDPADWAFSPANDFVFDTGLTLGAKGPTNHASPEEWIKRGPDVMRVAMADGSYDV